MIKKEKDRCFEIFHKPSITVPGMAQTVEEVFKLSAEVERSKVDKFYLMKI